VSHATRVWAALGVVYLVWGSTYLFIAIAGETIPPLFAAGTRFVASGLLMAGLAAWRRGPRVLRIGRRELAAAGLIGALLPGANAVVFVAERHVASGLAALIIGAVPLWIVLLRTLAGDRPSAPAIAGVLVGFGGLAILVRPGGGAPLWGLLILVGASLMWALGSFLSPKLPLPRDRLASTAWEMLCGGLLVLPFAALETRPHLGAISGRSLGGWLYLVTFGSVLAYTAYTWLLDNAPIGKVATYAYVNPVVAIALGALVLSERITWTIAVGAAIVLASVALVVREAPAPEPEAAHAESRRRLPLRRAKSIR
jgi:drug/metabolite transporter (DMT)-like permease